MESGTESAQVIAFSGENSIARSIAFEGEGKARWERKLVNVEISADFPSPNGIRDIWRIAAAWLYAIAELVSGVKKTDVVALTGDRSA